MLEVEHNGQAWPPYGHRKWPKRNEAVAGSASEVLPGGCNIDMPPVKLQWGDISFRCAILCYHNYCLPLVYKEMKWD